MAMATLSNLRINDNKSQYIDWKMEIGSHFFLGGFAFYEKTCYVCYNILVATAP